MCYKVVFGENNFDDDDTETIIHARLIASCNTYGQHKGSRNDISKILMTVVWHSIKWRDWCKPENGKKE